tara:strand:- start:105 stop:581 length:477 start_codon:yes stop_codon:yes gene_type:complete
MNQRHLIECHCVLPVYKDRRPIIYHKFSVYSKVDKKTGNVIPKYVNCNNCGVTHFVYEFCKSEIKLGKEDISSVRSISDIEISLPEKVVNILKSYQSTIDMYEEVEDIIDNDYYPRSIVLKREIIDEKYHFKILNLKNKKTFKVSSEIIDTVLIKEEE